MNHVIFTGSGTPHSGLFSIPSLIAHSLGHRDAGDHEAMTRFRMDSHAAQLEVMAAAAKRGDPSVRMDAAITPNQGLYLARQLEFRYAEILREPEKGLNGFELFPQDTSVPPGAKEHTVSRIYGSGDAVIYRGGNQGIPRVAVAQNEEQFKVKHLATSFGSSLFEQASANFANFAHSAELLRMARRVTMVMANRLIWDGNATHRIYGVLNYPWLAKRLIATPFDGTADPDDVLAALNRLANYPSEQSDGTMRPNACVTTEAVYNYLANTRLGSFSDKTILAHWLETNSLGIKRIEVAWELKGKGPGSTDGILFYLNDKRAVAHVLVQPFTTTPVQKVNFDDVTYAYMSTGGVIMRDAGCNILGWVTPRANS